MDVKVCIKGYKGEVSVKLHFPLLKDKLFYTEKKYVLITIFWVKSKMCAKIHVRILLLYTIYLDKTIVEVYGTDSNGIVLFMGMVLYWLISM